MDIMAYISELCPSYDYADVASVYFTAKLIIAYSSSKGYRDAIQNSPSLKKRLYIYKDIISPSLTDEWIDIWCTLCSDLSASGLDLDYPTFFSIATPNIVCDWHELLRHFPSHDTGRLLVALCLILRDLPDDALTVSDEFREQCYHASQASYHRIGIDYTTYTQCWKAIHVMDLSSSQHTPADSIISAVRLYHNLQLPMSDLLDNYAALYLNENDTDILFATRGARKQSGRVPQIEGGKTGTDLELERVLTGIVAELPTDVVRGLFYPPMRNDSGFECTYLLHHFYSTVNLSDSVLIANPSPDMMDYHQLYNKIHD